MRKNERVTLIVTGLFFAISAGVIVENGDTMMSGLHGDTRPGLEFASLEVSAPRAEHPTAASLSGDRPVLLATTELQDQDLIDLLASTIQLPSEPLASQAALGLGTPSGNAITQRLASLDADFQTPTYADHHKLGPFGAACSKTLSAIVMPGGMVKLSLSAPCHLYSRVVIEHSGMLITARTSHVGELIRSIPALEQQAGFSIAFADGSTVNASAFVPDLANMERVAIQWGGTFDLQLEALEYGAGQGSKGHVSMGRPRGFDESNSGGFLVALGESSVQNPLRSQVYTLPLTRHAQAGAIRLSVSAHGSASNCGRSETFQRLRSSEGQLVSRSALRFDLPDCRSPTQIQVLKNAVRDMNIALD